MAWYESHLNSGGGSSNSNAVLLWTGDFIGEGSITVDGLSDWLIVGYCNNTGADMNTYIAIGSPARGGIDYGMYMNNNIGTLAYRFGISGDTISISDSNRGLYTGSKTSYANPTDASCHVYAIYGLVRKPSS